MLNTVWGEIRQGKIELLENVALPEGARVLVTLVSEEDAQFWQKASEASLSAVWDNSEDDAYAQLLEE